MRKAIIVLGMVIMVGGVVFAASTDTIKIKVTCAVDIQVEITETEYLFGTLNAGATSISTYGVTVKNTSSSNQEDWELKMTEPGEWTSVTYGTPGQNVYKLQAQFSDTVGELSSWNDTSHSLRLSSDDCGDTRFGNGTALQCGYDVKNQAAGDEDRLLWFRIHMPEGVTAGYTAEQEITVTVTAKLG